MALNYTSLRTLALQLSRSQLCRCTTQLAPIQHSVAHQLHTAIIAHSHPSTIPMTMTTTTTQPMHRMRGHQHMSTSAQNLPENTEEEDEDDDEEEEEEEEYEYEDEDVEGEYEETEEEEEEEEEIISSSTQQSDDECGFDTIVLGTESDERISGGPIEWYISPLVLGALEQLPNHYHNAYKQMMRQWRMLSVYIHGACVDDEPNLRSLIKRAYAKCERDVRFIEDNFELRHSPKQFLLRNIVKKRTKVIHTAMLKIMIHKYPNWAENENWASHYMATQPWATLTKEKRDELRKAKIEAAKAKKEERMAAKKEEMEKEKEE